ncbi:MAG: OmpA family protein [Rhodocyclaceae bacterium]|nr:MAG: OmpA family protein [Rhodocyclaceae bacterium]
MKTIFRPATSALMCGLILLAMGSGRAVAADDDATKLKDLERAMSAPGDGDPAKRKPRTRAIVFDNANSPAAASAPAAALDCSNLPPDVKANAVDFAIQFQVGSSKVSPSSEATLGSIAKILALAPDRCVIVEGHTDSTGNADKNMALSRDRAGAVVNYITEKAGIERKRLVPQGKGSSNPAEGLAPNDPKNRRVVFRVVAG